MCPAGQAEGNTAEWKPTADQASSHLAFLSLPKIMRDLITAPYSLDAKAQQKAMYLAQGPKAGKGQNLDARVKPGPGPSAAQEVGIARLRN